MQLGSQKRWSWKKMDFFVRILGKWFAGRTIAGITGNLEFKTLKHSNNTWLQHAPGKYFCLLSVGPLLVYASYLIGRLAHLLQKIPYLYYILYLPNFEGSRNHHACRYRNCVLTQVNREAQLLSVRLLIGIFTAFSTSSGLFLCPAHFHRRGQNSTSKPEVQQVIRVQILSCFPNLQTPWSFQSCRMIESFFHFPAKHCAGSSMFIKAASCQVISSSASDCQGSLDLSELAQTSLPRSIWNYKFLYGSK